MPPGVPDRWRRPGMPGPASTGACPGSLSRQESVRRRVGAAGARSSRSPADAPPSAGCTRSIRPMTSRIRAVTALRARSDWSPSRRGCPPGPPRRRARAAARPVRPGPGRPVPGRPRLSASAISSSRSGQPRPGSAAARSRRAPRRRPAAGRPARAWPAPAAAIRSAAGTRAGRGEQHGQVGQALGVPHPHGHAAVGQRPQRALTGEHPLGDAGPSPGGEPGRLGRRLASCGQAERCAPRPATSASAASRRGPAARARPAATGPARTGCAAPRPRRRAARASPTARSRWLAASPARPSTAASTPRWCATAPWNVIAAPETTAWSANGSRPGRAAPRPGRCRPRPRARPRRPALSSYWRSGGIVPGSPRTSARPPRPPGPWSPTASMTQRPRSPRACGELRVGEHLRQRTGQLAEAAPAPSAGPSPGRTGRRGRPGSPHSSPSSRPGRSAARPRRSRPPSRASMARRASAA